VHRLAQSGDLAAGQYTSSWGGTIFLQMPDIA
jgi:hypothetical protein